MRLLGHLEFAECTTGSSFFDAYNMVVVWANNTTDHGGHQDVWIWDIVTGKLVTWQGDSRIIETVSAFSMGFLMNSTLSSRFKY